VQPFASHVPRRKLVVDRRGQRPVDGATVRLWSTRIVIAEADGSFTFEGLLPRTYRLLAQRDLRGRVVPEGRFSIDVAGRAVGGLVDELLG
jgi:hypothetical protein